MQQSGRRDFLKRTGASLAGTALAGSQRASAAANERIRIGLIGAGGRGFDHLRSIAKIENAELATVCDPDEERMSKAAAEFETRAGKRPAMEADVRKLLEDKSLDAVVIAACNHWHAPATIWACRAGKHVYVEKPVAHNLAEGRAMVYAARRYGRVVQAGTQRRSWGRFRKAMGLLHEGFIGDIYEVRWNFAGPRDSIGYKPADLPPPSLHWDLWLGPARKQPFHRNLVHYNWHWFWEFGNGEIGNNGPHFMDIACWGLRKGWPARVYSTGGRYGYRDQAETPNTQSAAFEWEDGTRLLCDVHGLYAEEGMGVTFHGSKGYLRIDAAGNYSVTLGRNKKPEPDLGKLEDVDHMRNFLDAVRAGKPELLHCPIEEAEMPSSLCHLANISYRLKRELHFDGKAMRFVADDEADRLLTREYRTGFAL